MTHQALTESPIEDPARPMPGSPDDSLEGLLGRLVETLQEQDRLRTLSGHWAELAVIQSALHELRAALATERGLLLSRSEGQPPGPIDSPSIERPHIPFRW
jgi:hypothetical protein